MNKHKHTPGPWAVRESSNPKNGTFWRDIVSTGGHFSPSYVGEAMEQDASLIAAAPELLAALRMVIAHDGRITGADWDTIRAAVDKAEGEG